MSVTRTICYVAAMILLEVSWPVGFLIGACVGIIVLSLSYHALRLFGLITEWPRPKKKTNPKAISKSPSPRTSMRLLLMRRFDRAVVVFISSIVVMEAVGVVVLTLLIGDKQGDSLVVRVGQFSSLQSQQSSRSLGLGSRNAQVGRVGRGS